MATTSFREGVHEILSLMTSYNNLAIMTIHGILGIEVTDLTARIDCKTGKIVEYRACVKLSFGVER
jgi:Dodecin